MRLSVSRLDDCPLWSLATAERDRIGPSRHKADIRGRTFSRITREGTYFWLVCWPMLFTWKRGEGLHGQSMGQLGRGQAARAV